MSKICKENPNNNFLRSIYNELSIIYRDEVGLAEKTFNDNRLSKVTNIMRELKNY